MSTSAKVEKSKRERPFRLKFHSWARWLHTYLSLFTLLLVLFFSVTGITLNHPDWVFGTEQTKVDYSGQLTPEWVKGEEPNWLKISDSVRKAHGIRGEVSDQYADEYEGSITYKGPGYSADVFFNREDGSYTASVNTTGAIAVLNDLHKGRDSGGMWKWVIDLSAGFLVLVSVTGVIMLFYLKKIKAKGLWTIAGGVVVTMVLMWLAVNR